MKKKTLKGLKVGRLTVLEKNGRNKWGRTQYLCECECGEKLVIAGGQLSSGRRKSCGCLLRIPMIGKRFGRMLVLKEVNKTKNGELKYLCECDCGTFKTIRGISLRNGTTKSCGCFRVEKLRYLRSTEEIKRKSTKINLTGKSFGSLTVVGDNPPSPSGATRWACRCRCGNKRIVSRTDLIRGSVLSCGKCEYRPNRKSLVDKTFGRLTVLAFAFSLKRRSLWECVCDCGETLNIRGDSMTSGRTRSCGCYGREQTTIKNSGENHPNWQGGISSEPYCDVWLDREFKESIKERDGYKCQNPDCWGTSMNICVHHIDYNKKNCLPKNLISLCVSCNTRANKNRAWHKEMYETIIKTPQYQGVAI